MQLVVISSEFFFRNESDITNELFREGMEYFHLRKPAASREEISNFIKEISPQFRCKISLHDHHHLAAEFGINRLHLKESLRVYRDEIMLEEVSNKDCIYSTSVHSIQDLKNLSRNFNYAFLSPVFDSISKRDYQGFSDDNFRIRDEWKVTRVVGLGGINETNFGKLKEMNFDGGAVLGYLWERPEDALKNFIKLRKHAE